MKMVNISQPCCMLLLICLSLLATVIAGSGRSRFGKRFAGRGGGGRGGRSRPNGEPKLFFRTRGFQSVTVANRHTSVFLECEAGGSPYPTIHWLKDGERISQGYFETIEDQTATHEMTENHADGTGDKLRLSSTKSRLYIDCATADDEGEYTCVAETPGMRKTQSTIVKVEHSGFSRSANCIARRSARGEPARVYMWTASRLEYEGATVQLYCRASGFPEPVITWYDRYNNTLPDDGEEFSLAMNGDLIIRGISWLTNMGVYRCVAENDFGISSVQTFLYPTPREDSFPLPV